MELHTQPHLWPPCPHPCTASLVWVCLACGQLAHYEAAPHYSSMGNVNGVENSLHETPSALSEGKAAGHAELASTPKMTQHPFGHRQCDAATGSAASAPASSSSSPATSTPSRQQPRHSCVNDTSDSYLSQAASFSRRQREQQRPSSVNRRVTGAKAGEMIYPESAGVFRERQKRHDGERVDSSACDLCEGEKALGDDGISSSHCKCAPTTVTTSHKPQLSTSLQRSLRNDNSTLAVTSCKHGITTLPQLSAASSSLERDSGIYDVPNVSSGPARPRQQEDNAMHSLTVLLMEEHLIGSRELRFCRCCGEVRCSEIRKLTELLPSSLPVQAADKASYTDAQGVELMAAAHRAMEAKHEHWKTILNHSDRRASISRDGGAEVIRSPHTSHPLHSGNESQPLGVSAAAAEGDCDTFETAKWCSQQVHRTFLHWDHQQTQPQPSGQAKAGKESLSLARLLSKIKDMALVAFHNFHPLSPALPKAYLSSHGNDEGDKAAMRGHAYDSLASGSAPRSAISIPRLSPRRQEPCRRGYPLYNPREGIETSSGHWKAASTEAHTRPCSASLLGITGGGAADDLNGVSSRVSAQPSWAFPAPDEEATYTAKDEGEGLLFQHQWGGVQNGEDASTVGAEDARVCLHSNSEDSPSTPNLTGTTAAAAATRMMRACKDKWNSISVSEALWRLVLPSFSAPFLSTTSVPSTAAAAVAARTTAVGRACSSGGSGPPELMMDWVASAPCRGGVESTMRSALATGKRPYRGFRGDIEEAVLQLDAAQLEVAKLRLQQVLAAVMTEQLRREGQSKGERSM
ncbi:hypothetical protein, unknown function [Leishmania tarentolae]|uniref:Uncharacterized protein n=1 Tax=Leishmania tarentolae TaxID=5689 RepID=A0A640KEI8_LEITA|nr:hypothetical protein, unknown function [Leishmania tarentolae]